MLNEAEFLPWSEVTAVPTLDAKCSRHFTWRALIACGPTYERLLADGYEVAPPQQLESWRMLAGLAQSVLDPLVQNFGSLVLSYGFAPHSLTRHIAKGIAPLLDQHVCCEVDVRRQPVCQRGGAAVDFAVPGTSSRVIAEWLCANLPVDRMYFYGKKKPIHVSWHPQPNASFWSMVKGPSGRSIPRPFHFPATPSAEEGSK